MNNFEANRLKKGQICCFWPRKCQTWQPCASADDWHENIGIARSTTKGEDQLILGVMWCCRHYRILQGGGGDGGAIQAALMIYTRGRAWRRMGPPPVNACKGKVSKVKNLASRTPASQGSSNFHKAAGLTSKFQELPSRHRITDSPFQPSPNLCLSTLAI